MEVFLAPTDWQTNDDPVCNATYGPSHSIVDQNLFPSVSDITAVAEVYVESMASFVQNLGNASIDLSCQVSSDHCEIVDEIVTGSGGEPFEAQDFVLHFRRCDEVFGLVSKPFCVLRRQDDRRPVERRSYERLAFAAVL